MSQRTQNPSTAPGELTLEPERVRHWRREQFHELGFTLSEAYELADAPVDLGVARRIIAAGCPRQTAIRILL
jgi:hypothetical protein